MASTYSNLKIQLMSTGENNTTWGNVTNTNLGTALEEAIAGTTNIAFSNANVTLTLTDTNSSQAARNMRLVLAGTATAGYNLIVPAIQKAYIVSNLTDGAITVKNATGGGIAVPAGKTMWVYNDSFNVADVVTHLSSLTTAGITATSITATSIANDLGTLATPSYTFTGDTNTGIFSPAADTLAFAVGGAETVRFLASGGMSSRNLADAVGYKGLPVNSRTASYTLALSDMGKHISITTGGVVIPDNGSVAFPIGATVVIYNNSSSTQTISILPTDTLRLAGTASTGSRTLAQRGLATCVKVEAGTWVVSGNVT